MIKSTLPHNLLLFCILFSNPLYSAPENNTPPNILVLVADDAGWRDFGCYGNDNIRTPNIDRLARSGLKAENAFLTIPQCSPSRISVLTGKYPHATGAEDLHAPLPVDQILIPTYLKRAGYYTGHMRKTHYGPNGDKQFDWYSKDLVDFADFIDASNDKPFFLWVGFRDPHRPYQDNTIKRPHDPAHVDIPPWLADTPETRADIARYYDEISRMDGVIGTYIKELKKRKLLNNTLIVFFSDNGEPFPRAKGTLYDAGIKTPLIFSWPGVIEPGTTYSGLTSIIHLAPTLLDVAGLKPPNIMQGKSIRGIFEDTSIQGDEYVFSERNWHNTDEHNRSVRTERYKLILNSYYELPQGSASDIAASPSWQSLAHLKKQGRLTPTQMLLFEVPRPRVELYDLQNDPWEINNVSGDPQNSQTVRQLMTVLKQWMEDTGDFPPTVRRRDDNVDRITGVKFTMENPPMRLIEKSPLQISPLKKEILQAINSGALYASEVLLDDQGKSRCDYDILGGKWHDYEPPWHTGQIIYALTEAYKVTGNEDYLDAARKAGDWWVSLQIKGHPKLDGMLNAVHGAGINNIVFATVSDGSAGLFRLNRITGDPRYAEVPTRAGQWMLDNMWIPEHRLFYDSVNPETGEVLKENSPFWADKDEQTLYDVARPNNEGSIFLDMYKFTKNEKYRKIFLQLCDSLIDYQDEYGLWMDFTPNNKDRGYFHPRFNLWYAESLLDGFDITGDKKYLDAALRTARFYTKFQQSDGTFYYRNFLDGKQNRDSTCGSAVSFTGILWLRLDRYGVGQEFEENIQKSLRWVLKHRYPIDHPDKNLAGGFLETRIRRPYNKIFMANRDIATSFGIRFLSDYFNQRP